MATRRDAMTLLMTFMDPSMVNDTETQKELDEETLAEIKSLRAAKKFDEARKQMQYLRQDLMGRRVERMARSLDE